MLNPKVSIIIVNYNSGKFLFDCLTSIRESLKITFEIIVIDNASTDNSIALINKYSSINFTLVRNKTNMGFARANNIGLEKAKGNLVHFLNPDTLVNSTMNNVYNEMINVFPDYVGVTKLKYSNGDFQNSKHLLPTIENYFRRLLFPKSAQYWYLGASVIFSKKIASHLKGWSEEYHMYAEDMDLFYRISKLNIPIHEFSESILHMGEGITNRVWTTREKYYIREKSTRRFYKIHFNMRTYWLMFVIWFFYRLFRHPKLAIQQFRYLLTPHG